MLQYNIRFLGRSGPGFSQHGALPFPCSSPRPFSWPWRPQPWPDIAPSGAAGSVVDPADDAPGPSLGCHSHQCGALGDRADGDEVTMAAQLQFRDVTLGYDRHPAVHHLNGEVAPGALVAVVGPNGAGKSTLFRGIVGILKPLAGTIGLGSASRPRHRLSSAERRHRPQFSDFGVRSGGHRASGAAREFSAVSASTNRNKSGRPSRPLASAVLRTALSARSRADRCSACCSPACFCRMRA